MHIERSDTSQPASVVTGPHRFCASIQHTPGVPYIIQAPACTLD